MDQSELLTDLYGRIPPLARDVVEGLPLERLTQALAPGTNTIAWLLWHVARVQDHHVSEILGAEQLWAGGPWPERFELDADPSNTGYGHRPADVATIRPVEPAVLTDYLDATSARTAELLASLSATDLDRIVDKRWDPPVTLGVRLVSIADDGLQHVGQAAYLRGVLES
jgi:uncharacterized damage-inducible protein DinB